MISARGWCIDHGIERQVQNNLQISHRQGPFFERWYAAMHERFEHSRRLDAPAVGD